MSQVRDRNLRKLANELDVVKEKSKATISNLMLTDCGRGIENTKAKKSHQRALDLLILPTQLNMAFRLPDLIYKPLLLSNLFFKTVIVML